MAKTDSTSEPDTTSEPVEEELVDVVVVLNASTPQEVRDALDGLRSVGMKILKVDEEHGVVEGVSEPKVLTLLRRLPTVKTARLLFEYIAERPKQEEDD